MKEKKNSYTLQFLGLPNIQSIEDLANETKLSKHMIYQLSQNSDYHYKVYLIPKKSGKMREIAQPSRRLKAIQSWILVKILNPLKSSENSKGFEKGQSTLDNARPHIGANVVLTIDIKDFFPTISSEKVFNVFKTVGYNNSISTILTNICTFKNCLPQGSPCSPKLANLICTKLDKRIQNYVGSKGITYTRYADDLTFSALTYKKLTNTLNTLNIILKSEKFEVNKDKTRLIGACKAKKITGLIITNEEAGIGKIEYRKIRSMIFNLKKIIIIKKEEEETAFQKFQQNTFISEVEFEKLINKIRGHIAYIKSVDSKRHEKILLYIKQLKFKFNKSLITKL